MNEFLKFLTSTEAVVVYIVVGLSCCLCFIIYLVDRYNTKLRRRHNTKELNKLVSQIKVEANLEEDNYQYDQPVLETLEENNTPSSVTELLEQTPALYEKTVIEEKVEPVPIVVEACPTVEAKPAEELETEKEELQYTTIEPNVEEAQQELSKLTEELQQQEEEIENSTLTNYEVQQEENAIISLEELIKRSKAMYEANELTQYADEGNEPISLEELEKRIGKETATYEEPFIIENVVPEEEIKEDPVVRTESVVIPETIEETSKKFKSSPIISPVFGIEKSSQNDLELENTANYTKFDAEIQKTNEFLMTLKELQEKLE